MRATSLRGAGGAASAEAERAAQKDISWLMPTGGIPAALASPVRRHTIPRSAPDEGSRHPNSTRGGAMRRLLVVVGLFLIGFASSVQAQFCPGVSPWVFDDVQASDPLCPD